MFYWLGIALLLVYPKVYAHLKYAEYDQLAEYDPELVLLKKNNIDIYSNENYDDDIREYNEYINEFNKNHLEKKSIIRNSSRKKVKTKHKKDLITKKSPKFTRKLTPKKTTVSTFSNLKNSDRFEEAQLLIDNRSTEPELHNYLNAPNSYQLVTKTPELNEKNNFKVRQSDNIGVASVTEDNNVSKEEELVQSVNPQDVFLEPSIINKTYNDKNGSRTGSSPAYHVHIVEVTNGNSFLHKLNSSSFIALIVCCCVAGVAAIVLTGYCWFKFGHDSGTKMASGSDFKKVKKEKYNQLKKSPKSGDETLAENAKMFHYVHQKKQMQQLSKNSNENQDFNANNTDDEDDENTVYECPGLAPPGDMKVVNPMFSDSENYPSSKCGSNAESPPPSYEDLHMETPTNN